MASISPSAPLYGSSTPPPASYVLNSKIMVAAIVVLFMVVSLMLILHLYARWFWNRSLIASRGVPLHGGNQPNSLSPSLGLDKAVVEQLPTFIFLNQPASTENLEATHDPPSAAPFLECAVCLSEFEDGEKGRMLPSCKHAFHVECIDMWFRSHSTCPLCRTVVSPPSPSKIAHEQTQEGAGEAEAAAQEGSMEAEMTLSDGNGMDTPTSTHNVLQFPCNVLFYGNQAQVTSHMTSPQDPSSSSSTGRRAHRLLHIAIEVPASTQGSIVNSPSPHGRDQTTACTPSQQQQPPKSPSLRLSIKRMLSRQRNEGSEEEYQKGATSSV